MVIRARPFLPTRCAQEAHLLRNRGPKILRKLIQPMTPCRLPTHLGQQGVAPPLTCAHGFRLAAKAPGKGRLPFGRGDGIIQGMAYLLQAF